MLLMHLRRVVVADVVVAVVSTAGGTSDRTRLSNNLRACHDVAPEKTGCQMIAIIHYRAHCCQIIDCAQRCQMLYCFHII